MGKRTRLPVTGELMEMCGKDIMEMCGKDIMEMLVRI
jgi:hypothetical protein